MNTIKELKEKAYELTAELNAARAELKQINKRIAIAEIAFSSIKSKVEEPNIVKKSGSVRLPFGDPDFNRVFIKESDITAVQNAANVIQGFPSIKEKETLVALKAVVVSLNTLVTILEPAKPIKKRMTFND